MKIITLSTRILNGAINYILAVIAYKYHIVDISTRAFILS